MPTRLRNRTTWTGGGVCREGTAVSRVSVVTALSVVAVLAAGCGSSSISGSAVAGGATSAGVVVFDPCVQVTEAMITSLGLDPSTKEPYTARGTTVENGCGWGDAPTMGRLLVDIGVNNTPIQKYLSNLGYTDAPQQNIGGRQAFQFQTARKLGTCSFAIDLGHAVVIIATSSASQTAGVPNPDSCPDAERIATAISPVLP